MDESRLRLYARAWTLTTAAHTIPLVFAGLLLFALAPVTFPVGLALLAHAWAIPELYANRGAKVVKPRRRSSDRAEATALGLLGDLVSPAARTTLAATGLVPERGALGTWLVGEAGALLVRRHRVHCFCVAPVSPSARHRLGLVAPDVPASERLEDPDLPSADRIAHLLLALREDEQGFATVANHAFSGARWRVKRRLARVQRPALDIVDSRGA
jgi:hypothetical protein